MSVPRQVAVVIGLLLIVAGVVTGAELYRRGHLRFNNPVGWLVSLALIFFAMLAISAGIFIVFVVFAGV